MIQLKFIWALTRCIISITWFNIRIPKAKNFVGSTNETQQDNSLLFVVGSGSSINHLREDDWAFIGKNRAIGVNDLVMHPWVFHQYALEVFHDESKFEDRIQKYVDRFGSNKLNMPALTIKGVATSRVILALRRVLERGVLADMEKSVHIHFPLTVQARNMDEFLRYWQLYEMFVPTFLKSRIFLNQSSTVIRMIMGNINTDARNIVVIGVDLGGPYFWEESELSGGSTRWKHGNGPHITNSGEFGIEGILEGLEDRLEASAGKHLIWLRKEDLAAGDSLQKLVKERSQ